MGDLEHILLAGLLTEDAIERERLDISRASILPDAYLPVVLREHDFGRVGLLVSVNVGPNANDRLDRLLLTVRHTAVVDRAQGAANLIPVR
jgi:hypothetical protein